MEIETFFPVAAVSVSYKEVTFRHLTQVVLVEKLALFAFFAEGAEPVLAYQAAS